MKTIITLMLTFAAACLFASGLSLHTGAPGQVTVSRSPERSVVFSADFEDSASGWSMADGTLPANWNEAWHLSLNNAYDGRSWWMGDEALGGYANHRYLVLDTPGLPVTSGQSTLSFRTSYALEIIGGTGSYDAWDGFNVRLSTDDGETWTVLNGSPAYTATSVYAFGAEFDEGTNVPGWCGNSNGWIQASFNLSAYIGQTVKIRFAFASDPATSTADDSSLFGAKIDDITLGSFVSNGETPTNDNLMVPGYGGVIGGDYWVLSDAEAYSPDYSMACSMHANLYDQLRSPLITIPNKDHVELDFQALFDAPDVDSDGDGLPDDYYMVFAGGQNDPAWTRLLYDHAHGDPVWTHVDGNYTATVLDTPNGCDLSAWAGQRIWLKFVLVTDDDTPSGNGLFLDDIRVIAYNDINPPATVSAARNDNRTISLTWSPVTNADTYSVWQRIPGEEAVCIVSGLTDTSYVNTSLRSGRVNIYHIRAENTETVSELSAAARVFVPSTSGQLSYFPYGDPDNAYIPEGTDEALMPADAPDATIPWYLTHVEIYLSEIGSQNLNIIVRENGEEHPGSVIADYFYPLSELVVGWNTICLPNPMVVGPRIWVGIRGTVGLPFIGATSTSQDVGLVRNGGNYYFVNLAFYARAWFDIAADTQAGVNTPNPINLTNSPNPFNPSTDIRLSLSEPALTTLRIYNLRGQCVATLEHRNLTAGEHHWTWNGTDTTGRACASGVYLCRVQAGKASLVRRMMLLK